METQGLNKKYSASEILVEVICFLFILLFVYAAVSKLLDYQKFTVQLGKSPLLTHYADWMGWVVPAIEILISLMLDVSRWRLFGLYASFGLMVMFTTYIIAITHFSDFIPCSCGGVLQNLTWNKHLIFNSGFVLLALLALVLSDEIKTRSTNHFIAIKSFLHEQKPSLLLCSC